MIPSAPASRRLKAAACTASGANLLATSYLAHVVYTSKSGVKLFQLGPQRHSQFAANLPMKGGDRKLAPPILAAGAAPYIFIGLFGEAEAFGFLFFADISVVYFYFSPC